MSYDIEKLKITASEIDALRSIQNRIFEQNNYMGWHSKPREAGTMLALCHSELSEALEGIRKNLNDTHLPNRPMAEVELADCVIRILDMAGKYGWDIAGALANKHEYNRNRDDHKLENREKSGGKAF